MDEREPQSSGERARQSDLVLALGIAIAGTWALPRFVLIPLLKLFKLSFAWWLYALTFLVLFGSGLGALTKQRAEENLAYGSKAAKRSDQLARCPSCGHDINGRNKFCPDCGTKL